MSSLAAIMARQEAEASREAAVRVEIMRQRTQAQVLQEADLDEDMKLALALSRADMEGSADDVPPMEHDVVVSAGAEEAAEAVDADLQFALKLQAEEEAAAQGAGSISAHGSKVRTRRRGERVAVDSTVFGTPTGLWSAEDADVFGDELDQQLEEEEEEYASLVGTLGRRSRDGKGAWTTKHDARVSGRKNVRRLEQRFPAVGNLSEQGTRLSNRVAGDLTRHFSKRTRKGVSRSGRVEGAVHATQEGVLDERTRLVLFKLCNTVLREMHGVVKTGKEASVYTATGWTPSALTALAVPQGLEGDAPPPNPVSREGSLGGTSVASAGGGHPSSTVLPVTPEDAAFPPFSTASEGEDTMVALKIFRSTLNEFKNRSEYVVGDHRYTKGTGGRTLSKQNPRKVVKLWAEKEWANLTRMWRAGLPCPQPLVLRQHVLVMSWLGDAGGFPAPQLREVKLPSARAWASAYTQVVRIMAGMYHRCKLVHGDLSEYNLLWHDKRVFVIDTAQAVEVSHPNAGEFLRRDVANITAFFSKKGVHVLPTPEAVQFIVAPATACDPALPAVYKTAQGRGADGTEVATGSGADAPFAQTYIFGSKEDPVVAAVKAAMEEGMADPTSDQEEGDPAPVPAYDGSAAECKEGQH